MRESAAWAAWARGGLGHHLACSQYACEPRRLTFSTGENNDDVDGTLMRSEPLCDTIATGKKEEENLERSKNSLWGIFFFDQLFFFFYITWCGLLYFHVYNSLFVVFNSVLLVREREKRPRSGSSFIGIETISRRRCCGPVLFFFFFISIRFSMPTDVWTICCGRQQK